MLVERVEEVGQQLQVVVAVELVELLAGALPPRKASDIAAQLTGGKKNDFYKRILQQSEKDRSSS